MRRGWLWLVPGALIVGAGALWASGHLGVGRQILAMQGADPRWQESGLWLPFYSATIEARPVKGLADNVSGLTYNPATGTLFTVINRPPAVAELSTDGVLLRQMPLAGADDPEGITHVSGDLFAISDEGTQSLHWLRIPPGDAPLTLVGSPRLDIETGSFGNMGFEGISWDEGKNRLMVAQEMWPIRILSVEGLDPALPGTGAGHVVRDWTPKHPLGHAPGDLSSLSVHDATGNLLLLSHLTSALIEYTPDGDEVSVMPLWAGWHGLRETIPQAEGLATDPAGDIYIVSEPNLFYRFARTTPPLWAGGAE